MLARALAGAGRMDDAAQLRETMLALSSSVVDDVGVPFSFYAAMGLLESGGAPDRLQRWMKDELDRNIWRGPVATYLLRDVVAGIVRTRGDSTEHRSRQLADRVDDEITLVERVLELQRQFPMLGLSSNDDGAVTGTASWVLFDDGDWLVSVASMETEPDAVIALDAAAALAAVSVTVAGTSASLPRFRFTRGATAGDGRLGPRLPGLGVAFPEDPGAAVARAVWPQRAGYLGILGFVLSVTLFGGYLLLRDVRRETRLAALRSHFVSSVSHELKTPLTSIRMFAETLRMRGATDPSTQAEYLDTIVGESERLTRLLNNVLDHSQIEQDRKIYHPTTTSLPDIVDRAAAAMEYPPLARWFHVAGRRRGGVGAGDGGCRRGRAGDAESPHQCHEVLGRGSRDRRASACGRWPCGDRGDGSGRRHSGAGAGQGDGEILSSAVAGKRPYPGNRSRPDARRPYGARPRWPTRGTQRGGSRQHVRDSPAAGGYIVSRILVVEDDPAILRGLSDNLKAESYEVLTASDGKEGYRLIVERKLDLIILDLMLPKLGGYEVCRKVRGEGVQTPILILSARGEESDRVLGLDLGADDYVTKPFSVRELLARVRALLRRARPATALPSELRFADVVVDFKRFESRKGDTLLEMTRKEFGMLQFLAARAGEVVRRDELLDEVWDYRNYPTTRTVDNHIASLRAKIEDDASAPQHLLTVHGVGYKLVM